MLRPETFLYINSITPPQEVQKAIDDKSKLGVFDDLNKLLKMKAAMAVEKISEQQGEAGAGIGMGMGFMMPAMFSDLFKGKGGSGMPDDANGDVGPKCPDCQHTVSKDARFCPACGHQIVIFQQCHECGKNLSPSAKFCSKCGVPVQQKAEERKCSHCGAENLKGSVFCNQCGERV